MIALDGSYNIWLVLLSLIIVFFTSYQAIGLAKKMLIAPGEIAWGWLTISSVVMGCGIWTLHYLGMISFHLPLHIDYRFAQSVLSIVISVGASFLAFYILSLNKTNRSIIAASFIIAAGIVSMHYVGMSSIKNEYMSISYNYILWGISAGIAWLCSYTAFWIIAKMKFVQETVYKKGLAALFMAVAVTGMHYVGMEASTFWCIDPQFIQLETANKIPGHINILITVAILLLLLLTWVAQVWEQIVYKKMAFTDSLTGLENRHAMNDFFKKHSFQKQQYAIMFIDLDHFKYVNDTLGHDVGDQLITSVGERLKAHSLGRSYTFRLGGDEFMIAMRYDDRESVIKWTEKLLEELRKPFLIGEHSLEISGSIGLSYSHLHGKDKDSLLKAADTAMYYAKGLGKNQFAEYNVEMEKKLNRKLEIEKGLREAITNHELELYYQPKWDVQAEYPIGFEALLRYKHPILGMIYPDEFIPIAESKGLIMNLSDWVLNTACNDCVHWNTMKNGAFIVSVNVSSKLIESNQLYTMTRLALQKSGLDPKRLELEITERTIYTCMTDIVKQMKPIQELGINISVDNFGSGNSFLGSIDQLTLQSIKLDRTFIADFEKPSKRAIIHSMIELTKQLQIDLIAEGVETDEQLAYMKKAGCRLIQGYYIKEPMPVNEVDRWLKQL